MRNCVLLGLALVFAGSAVAATDESTAWSDARQARDPGTRGDLHQAPPRR